MTFCNPRRIAAIFLAPALLHSVAALAGLDEGLILHLDFEGDFLDRTANAYDGQESGGVLLEPGIDGSSATFDGVDDQLLFPTFPDGEIAAGDLTIAYWFRIPEGPLPAFTSVIGKRAICNVHPFLEIRLRSDRIKFLEVADPAGAYYLETSAIDTGWQHLAFTRAARVLQAYLNGELVETIELPRDLDFTNMATLGVSNSPCVGLDGTQMLNGSIDDLRIYSRALSSHEVRRLFAIFIDGFEDQ